MHHIYILPLLTILPLAAEQIRLDYELFTAIHRNDFQEVRYLLQDLRVPVHITNLLPDDPFGFEETPLLTSIKKNNFCSRIFNLILARNADVNQTSQNGMSPLHKAVLCANAAAVQVLLIRGANTKAKLVLSNAELNPLELAERINQPTIATLIRQTEANRIASSNNTN